MVCAQNFFRRKGTKPILQVNVYLWTDAICTVASEIGFLLETLPDFMLSRVGNYGTRNIVVIGVMVLERPTDCIVLIICLSSILRGIPLSGGIRLALSLRP
jgi:hypothetical protein